jgi:hypothetical protein
MKKIIIFFFLIINIPIFGQTSYSRGFQNGYKDGYCYREQGCLPPITPITPIPRLGENQDSYQDGFNRGFIQGLEDKQPKKSSSSRQTEIQGNYSAPFLGESSHDPIEFARRSSIAAQESATFVQSKGSNLYLEGIDKYDLKMEIWEDQMGYEELSKKISVIQNVFIEFIYKGMNLISPTTTEELMLYKAMNEAMDLVRSKYNIWQSQKYAYHAAENLIYEQLLKKESERIIDIESTRANMRVLLSTPEILNRSKITENIIVYKPIVEEK